MSRPASPYVPNGQTPSTSNMHQLSSSTRPSTDSGHDLPYLRSDRRDSEDSSSGARPSTPSQLTPRPSAAPGRAATQDYPTTSYKHEPPPRPSRSASGHTSPVGPNDFAAPSPAWLGSTSRPGSEEGHRFQHTASSISGHSNSNTEAKSQTCSACGKPMTGQFVRALGTVYHLDCFRCKVGAHSLWGDLLQPAKMLSKTVKSRTVMMSLPQSSSQLRDLKVASTPYASGTTLVGSI